MQDCKSDAQRRCLALRNCALKTGQAFTLIEMMVSLAILALMLIVIAQITNSTGKLWQGTNDKISAFQNSRAAFETMTQTLGQATLNTYFDYYDNTGARNTAAGSSTFDPYKYDRFSELHFISGPVANVLNGINRKDSTGSTSYPAITSGHAVFFQAALGYTKDITAKKLDNTLNALGYFVEFGTDKDFMPPLISSKIKPRYRYRLVQLLQPAEDLTVYKENWSLHTNGTKADWFKTPLELQIASTAPRPTQILAENVVAIIIRPKRSDKEYEEHKNDPDRPAPLAPNYTYDSQPKAVIPPDQSALYPTRYQLPPLISVTVVAIDETSAVRLEAKYKNKAPLVELGLSNLFKTTADTNVSTEYDNDLKTLKDTLIAQKVNFRIFETELIIRASKWTKD